MSTNAFYFSPTNSFHSNNSALSGFHAPSLQSSEIVDLSRSQKVIISPPDFETQNASIGSGLSVSKDAIDLAGTIFSQ